MISDAALAGVGSARESAEAIDLMEIACRRALADAGVEARELGAVLIPTGTWPYGDPGRELARRLGASDAISVLGQLGISQQGLISAGLELLSGSMSAVVVVGGESRRWSADPAAYAALDGTPDQVLERPEAFVHDLEIAAGLAFPAVRSYALIERAASSRQGLSDAQAAQLDAALWSRLSAIAAGRPGSLVEEAVEPGVVAGGEQNRMLAAPYRRLHASQWTVDQAAALVLVDGSLARRLEPSALLHPLVALESTDVVPVVERADPGRWPAMGVLGRAAEAWLGWPLGEVDLVDLYSCFPIAVRLQAEELGIDLDADLSVTGGMTFAGGPFNSYVLEATVAMAESLRAGDPSTGLVTTVSGLLTKPGLAVWSTERLPAGALVADLAEEASIATATVRCEPAAPGETLRIETATAWREGEVGTAAVLGRDAAGRRRLALLHDLASVERFEASGCVGEELFA